MAYHTFIVKGLCMETVCFNRTLFVMGKPYKPVTSAMCECINTSLIRRVTDSGIEEQHSCVKHGSSQHMSLTSTE